MSSPRRKSTPGSLPSNPTPIGMARPASPQRPPTGRRGPWTQMGGPAVPLSDPNAANPTFNAPDVADPTSLTFQLRTSDGSATATDTVSVLVNPVAPVAAPSPPPPPPP